MTRQSWLCAFVLLSCGCTPALDVLRNPGPHDAGLRYYRPKPYLLVEPVAADAGGKDGAEKGCGPRGDLFKISLEYLPDFSEEYAVNVRTGLGACKTKLTLEHGWNLTAVDLDYESKASDNVNAAANLLKAAVPDGPGAIARGSGQSNSTGATHQFCVRASNVPIGYYESVIGPDPCSGKKQLFGFRYVGFIPFASCPINPTGGTTGCCADGSMPLYGLVFERGVMTFKPLGYEIQPDNTLIQVTKTEAHVEKAEQTAMNANLSTAPSRAPSSGRVPLARRPEEHASTKPSANAPARPATIRVLDIP
jgi:hypothetical protein